MASKYEKGLYKDYEKAVNKLDAVLSELTSIRKEHKNELKKLRHEFTLEKKEIKEI